MRDRDESYYNDLFWTMEIDATRWTEIRKAVDSHVGCYLNLFHYFRVEKETGVPWVFVALAHYRECGNDFTRQILNGEPFSQKTTLHPSGLGPWDYWHDSAIFAIQRFLHAGRAPKYSNSIHYILSSLEAWNGLGYAMRGVNSPYLWAGSNHGEGVGKYIFDGEYDPNAKDKQLGCAVLLKILIEEFTYLPKELINPIKYGMRESESVKEFQRQMNSNSANYKYFQKLKIDGWAGFRTSNACFAVTGNYLKGDPRT